jgi:hypothetical protein
MSPRFGAFIVCADCTRLFAAESPQLWPAARACGADRVLHHVERARAGVGEVM